MEDLAILHRFIFWRFSIQRNTSKASTFPQKIMYLYFGIKSAAKCHKQRQCNLGITLIEHTAAAAAFFASKEPPYFTFFISEKPFLRLEPLQPHCSLMQVWKTQAWAFCATLGNVFRLKGSVNWTKRNKKPPFLHGRISAFFMMCSGPVKVIARKGHGVTHFESF